MERSSALGLSTTSFDESLANASKNHVIDINRHSTHKIYNIAETVKKHFLKRNCDFKFYEDKSGKHYKQKDLSLKVYMWDSNKGDNAGVKKGNCEINLSNYIGQGLKTECFLMDLDKKTQNIWLTVRIAVIELDSSKDITTISMLATQR